MDPSHEWEAGIYNRAKLGSGCLPCSGQVATLATSLQALRPELAAEWHPEKNGGRTPADVKPGSGKRVWWRCGLDPSHEWEAVVGQRASGSGCPYCSGRRPTDANSLAALRPDLVEEWHPAKNEDCTPEGVKPGSNKRVWWRCRANQSHAWQAVVYERAQGGGACPRCASLEVRHPELAAEWHPDKNPKLSPSDVKPGSNRKVWWRCRADPPHEWQAIVASRVRGDGCRVCIGRVASDTTSLRALHPDLSEEWHPDKNDLTPDDVVPGTPRKVWWRCRTVPSHEWEATVVNRTRKGSGCPKCSGRVATETTSLRALRPDLVEEWHPNKNGSLTPDRVKSGSNKRVWWRCRVDPSHEWAATIADRARGRGCAVCRGLVATSTTSLQALHPELAAEWHPQKNGDRTPETVTPGSGKQAWWRCSTDPSHEWEAVIGSQVSGRGCPVCSRQVVTSQTSLRWLHPSLAEEWHPDKNGDRTPDMVMPGSHKKAWWRCRTDPSHEWEAAIGKRVGGHGCPMCGGRVVTPTTSLAALHPELAAEWHPDRNGELGPDDALPGTHRKVWWRCRVDPSHVWEAQVVSRTRQGRGCPRCNKGWTIPAIRHFVASLQEHLHAFTPSELFLLFQQSGLLQTKGSSRAFVKALVTGRFPRGDIERFVEGEPSLVDEFLQDPTRTLEGPMDMGDAGRRGGAPVGDGVAVEEMGDVIDDDLGRADRPVDATATAGDSGLPVVEARDVLRSLDLDVVTSADEEAVEYLLASAVTKLWKNAFRDEEAAVAQAEAFRGRAYAEQAQSRFLEEYGRARDLIVPDGYAFRVDRHLTSPNLMQRLVAIRVRDSRRLGNWSGTGAGKTLSAILASRVVDAGVTVICCPNSVVEGWRREILGIFPDSVVATKTFEPAWAKANGDETGFGVAMNDGAHRYLVLNYEAFQQPNSDARVRSLVEREPIDFLIVDEIHYAKQRSSEDLSKRRRLVTALASLAAERNPGLRVLGMSATPVINNLQEGKSMVELVTGVAHDELDTLATVANCMRLHQRLVTLGIRWMPDYALEEDLREVEVDCGEFVDEIRALGRRGSPLKLEQILTQARLPVIRAHVEPKTLIYTYNVEGIDKLLRDALVADGWKVGFYTGEDKSGLDGFLEGDVDVLIGSSAIGTGVDGLQRVCNRLIVNVLPWTAAEFEQLKGRIYRQGQPRDTVTVVIPLTYAEVRGERWSWCESKMQRLRFKKSIADAAVDGVVPEGHLRTPAQAYQDVMAWLQRLDDGQVEAITRPRIVVPLSDADRSDVDRRRRRYGDLSRMNHAWNRGRSEVTHERLRANPEEWAQYHTLYREAREGWTAVPYEEMIRWCRQRSGYVIGDFGCGEAKLAEAVKDLHTIHSFDHVAINDDVVACDMAAVPLDDGTLDVAIFSLSLMGANFADYLREAHRTLKLDGQLHIIEASSRFSDRDRFAEDLGWLGFDVVRIEDRWRFTHIRAVKTERRPRDGVEVRF